MHGVVDVESTRSSTCCSTVRSVVHPMEYLMELTICWSRSSRVS